MRTVWVLELFSEGLGRTSLGYICKRDTKYTPGVHPYGHTRTWNDSVLRFKTSYEARAFSKEEGYDVEGYIVIDHMEQV